MHESSENACKESHSTTLDHKGNFEIVHLGQTVLKLNSHLTISLVALTKHKTYRIRTAKQLHYKKLMGSCKNNIKKTWQVLKPIIGEQGDRTSLPSTFMYNNNAVNNSQNISDEFCKFFTQ